MPFKPKPKNDAAAMESFMRGNSDDQGQEAFGKATGGEDAGKASPEEAGYQGPEQGPFACGNCSHFYGQGACEIVAGQIDAEGCCNQFSSGGGSDAKAETEPTEEPVASRSIPSGQGAPPFQKR